MLTRISSARFQIGTTRASKFTVAQALACVLLVSVVRTSKSNSKTHRLKPMLLHVIHLSWRLRCHEFLGKMAGSPPDRLAASGAFPDSPVDRNWSWPLRFIDERIRHCAHLPQATCKNVFARTAHRPGAGRSNDR